MRGSLLSLVLFSFLAASVFAAEPTPAAEPAPAAASANALPERLAKGLSGAFSNQEQARSDFNYHDVVLHGVRIWTDRPDGPWLYLEQALANAPTQPYRQQVYQLVAAGDGQVDLRVFNLPDPIALTAAWREPGRFAALAPTTLVACSGCTLHLKLLPDGSIKGATEGRGCASEISNAAYASTELTVTEQALVFWDRGFNATGLQVWGPVHTGYLFKRVE